MRRRKFLQNSTLFTAPLILGGQKVFANQATFSPRINAIAKAAAENDKILIIIQLNGGNDGLNMVIPLDEKYDLIKAARTRTDNGVTSTLMVPKADVLSLNGQTSVGLHPSMPGVKNLFDSGKMRIVQGVSYPNPNFSHFRAQDIFFTGAPANAPAWDTGWIGRAIDLTYPNFPEGYPNTSKPHPPAIQIGGTLPILLQGESLNVGYTVPSNASLLQVLNPQPNNMIANDYDLELDFLRIMKHQSNKYAAIIAAAYGAQLTQSTKYAASENTLSDQLKTVARMIGGGLTTPVYVVNHPDSFDTHVNQVISTSPVLGNHANYLSKLSVAIEAFQDDLTLMGKSSKVVGMTFSEFGRRIAQNASLGTDHGQGAPILFFGDGVEGGVSGTTPQVTTITSSTQVPTQFDFRQLYSTVLKQWLGYSEPEVSGPIFQMSFDNAVIFKSETPLALHGFNVKAAWINNVARISFEMYDNTGQASYELERNTDLRNSNFQKVAVLINESDLDNVSYEFFDTKIAAQSIYYRVVAIEKSGKRVTSKIVYLENNENIQKISVFPNPIVNETINIDLFENITGEVELNIFESNGTRLYYEKKYLNNGSKLIFRVADMFEGNQIYILKLNYNYKQAVEKIIFSK